VTSRDELTEDYDTHAARSESPLCVSVQVGETFILQLPARGRITFGRGSDADVRLVVPSVSRMHVALGMDSGGLTLFDLGSRNGTSLNGTRISEPVHIGLGAEVLFGAVRMLVLPVSALPTGAHALMPRAQFTAWLDAQLSRGAPLRLHSLRLRTPFHEAASLLKTLAVLPGALAIGIVDAHILAVATALVAHALPSDVAIEAIGVATSDAAERASALLARALRAQAAPAVREAAAESAPPAELDAETLRMAQSNLAVLIVGETGVGKELMAQRLHAHSGRTGPMVAVNAAALPENLIESELFGHERGAFSGADKAKRGLVEAADKGTLFLDEIGDLPLALQAKLLRVLEDKRVRPVGATSERPVDVRIVAATHRDLTLAVRDGRFRQDLLFRLNACVVRIPPLRERREELPALAQELLRRIADEAKSPRRPRLSAAAVTALQAHSWPGNVRELKNALERAFVLVDADELILPHHLPAQVLAAEADLPPAAPPDAPGEVRMELKEYERARIKAALDAHEGSVAKAAEALGLPRRTLAYRMSKLGIRGK
jgi:two-component system response regulator AtoC